MQCFKCSKEYARKDNDQSNSHHNLCDECECKLRQCISDLFPEPFIDDIFQRCGGSLESAISIGYREMTSSQELMAMDQSTGETFSKDSSNAHGDDSNVTIAVEADEPTNAESGKDDGQASYVEAELTSSEKVLDVVIVDSDEEGGQHSCLTNSNGSSSVSATGAAEAKNVVASENSSESENEDAAQQSYSTSIRNFCPACEKSVPWTEFDSSASKCSHCVSSDLERLGAILENRFSSEQLESLYEQGGHTIEGACDLGLRSRNEGLHTAESEAKLRVQCAKCRAALPAEAFRRTSISDGAQRYDKCLECMKEEVDNLGFMFPKASEEDILTFYDKHECDADRAAVDLCSAIAEKTSPSNVPATAGATTTTTRSRRTTTATTTTTSNTATDSSDKFSAFDALIECVEKGAPEREAHSHEALKHASDSIAKAGAEAQQLDEPTGETSSRCLKCDKLLPIGNFEQFKNGVSNVCKQCNSLDLNLLEEAFPDVDRVILRDIYFNAQSNLDEACAVIREVLRPVQSDIAVNGSDSPLILNPLNSGSSTNLLLDFSKNDCSSSEEEPELTHSKEAVSALNQSIEIADSYMTVIESQLEEMKSYQLVIRELQQENDALKKTNDELKKNLSDAQEKLSVAVIALEHSGSESFALPVSTVAVSSPAPSSAQSEITTAAGANLSSVANEGSLTDSKQDYTLFAEHSRAVQGFIDMFRGEDLDAELIEEIFMMCNCDSEMCFDQLLLLTSGDSDVEVSFGDQATGNSFQPYAEAAKKSAIRSLDRMKATRSNSIGQLDRTPIGTKTSIEQWMQRNKCDYLTYDASKHHLDKMWELKKRITEGKRIIPSLGQSSFRASTSLAGEMQKYQANCLRLSMRLFPQGVLFDIHGFTVTDAGRLFYDLVAYAQSKDYTFLALITGRGSHSINRVPLLLAAVKSCAQANNIPIVTDRKTLRRLNGHHFLNRDGGLNPGVVVFQVLH